MGCGRSVAGVFIVGMIYRGWLYLLTAPGYVLYVGHSSGSLECARRGRKNGISSVCLKLFCRDVGDFGGVLGWLLDPPWAAASCALSNRASLRLHTLRAQQHRHFCVILHACFDNWHHATTNPLC